MHYEYLDGSHWLFGGTITNNWAANRAGYRTVVFLVELDSTTGDTDTLGVSTPYNVRELARGNNDYHQESKIIGIRQTMEKDGADYYLHIMFE